MRSWRPPTPPAVLVRVSAGPPRPPGSSAPPRSSPPDPGGYQGVSLADARVGTAEGATFRCHIDGALHHLTPEIAIEAQEALGPDIAVAFDHPVYPSSPRAEGEDALERTHRWADRR